MSNNIQHTHDLLDLAGNKTNEPDPQPTEDEIEIRTTPQSTIMNPPNDLPDMAGNKSIDETTH
jgi:hypothetical protein